MRRYSLLLFLVFFLPYSSFSQKDTTVLSPEETKALLQQIREQIKLDTVRELRKFAGDACKCIDAISPVKKDQKQISSEVGDCINKQVIMLEALIQTDRGLKEGNLNILINTDKESQEFKEYYYRMEEWLMDSCASISSIITANNKESEFSVSKNKKALEQYAKGEALFEQENYKEALPWFEKAVATDPKFAFAWDNIGICNRRLGNFDIALAAYYRSLELDPTGKTPLHNIPVVCEYKKEYDKAIEIYKKLSKIYPDDPEAYYGLGRMYELKDDLEKALDYMCKAYNAYVDLNSAYRVDAQNNIGFYYKKLKEMGKEELFNKILKDNHISTK